MTATLESLQAENLRLRARLAGYRFGELLAERYRLSPGQLRLLLALFAAPGPIPPRELLNTVKQGRVAASSKLIPVLINRLRQTLGADSIETLAGAGYRLADPLREILLATLEAVKVEEARA